MNEGKARWGSKVEINTQTWKCWILVLCLGKSKTTQTKVFKSFLSSFSTSLSWTEDRQLNDIKIWYLCFKPRLKFLLNKWLENKSIQYLSRINPGMSLYTQKCSQISLSSQPPLFCYTLPGCSAPLPTSRSLKQVLLAAAKALINNCIWNLSNSQTVVKSCKLKILGSPGKSLFKIMFNLLLISSQQFDPDPTVM